MSKKQKGRSGSSRNRAKKKPNPESQEKKTNRTGAPSCEAPLENCGPGPGVRLNGDPRSYQ